MRTPDILGFDLDDSVYLPVARAMAMFNQESLMEIDLLALAVSAVIGFAAGAFPAYQASRLDPVESLRSE